MTPNLAPQLADIVGSRYVLHRPAETLVYTADGLPGYRKQPSLVVLPSTREEVIAIVRQLARARVPFVPRGAGTGLSGGALAEGAVLLGLHRLRRIIAIDADNRTATVEPGVVNATLSRAAAPFGLHYAPDPSSQAACTIGGNVAENAGGPHCLKYGVTMNHVLAVTVVLPDGTVTALGSADGEPAGYDLAGAFVGSEGCFGIALDVTVRLTRNPEAVRTLLADFPSIEAAAQAVSAIVATGIVPAALEMMDRATIRAVEASIYAAGYPTDAAAVLLIEVDGDRDLIEKQAARIQDLIRPLGLVECKIARDAAESEALWKVRRLVSPSLRDVNPDKFNEDIVVPRSKVPDVIRAIDRIRQKYDIPIVNFGHAGDGNIHVNVMIDRSVAG
ncbi:MAG: FAD-binding protein, partial [Gemmatimonadaceae bacterium]|nr:FAD-binding protein [Gemmatimonadaceae bacterium]